MAPSQPPQKAPPSPAKTGYLVVYNFASAVAWSVVLGRTVAICALRGPGFVYDGAGEWTKWTQTVAAMEILHSLLGVVRAPLFTTLMQVSSRFLLVWAIVESFPFLAFSPFYSSMLVAWSVTEVIRYSYFALSLSGWQPAALTWLRYNTFFVLYPLGIFSECSLIYMATVPAAMRHPLEKYVLYAILAIYVPGAYILYTHMMTQRNKVMRSAKVKGEKATQSSPLKAVTRSAPYPEDSWK
ncbi:Protein tyrosine phosphatase, partial [Tolypocladium paradoxum]